VKRWLRMLLIAAPMIVLLLGIPTGVALARRATPSEPIPFVPRIGTAQPGARPPFTGTQRLIGPPLPISRAQSGTIGVVTRAAPDRLVVYTRAKKLAFVTIDPVTTIRMNGKNITATDIQRGDRVTILGHRDSTGAFHANLIRVTRPVRPDPPLGQAR